MKRFRIFTVSVTGAVPNTDMSFYFPSLAIHSIKIKMDSDSMLRPRCLAAVVRPLRTDVQVLRIDFLVNCACLVKVARHNATQSLLKLHGRDCQWRRDHVSQRSHGILMFELTNPFELEAG
jgi:hypothetical protein